MKITLTKRQVISALQTEPLKSGSYFHDDEFDDNGNTLKEFKNNSGCAVCAVGSLLDCSLANTKKFKGDTEGLGTIGSFMTTAATLDQSPSYTETSDSLHEMSVREITNLARKEARAGRYLSALSGLFEALSANYESEYTTYTGLANYRLVNILVNFVKSEFPAKLELSTKKRY